MGPPSYMQPINDQNVLCSAGLYMCIHTLWPWDLSL